MEEPYLSALLAVYALLSAGIGAFLMHARCGWKLWRARREWCDALELRRRSMEDMAEAQRLRAVWDDLPADHPKKLWGEQVHEAWTVLKQERDEARREAAADRDNAVRAYRLLGGVAQERDSAHEVAADLARVTKERDALALHPAVFELQRAEAGGWPDVKLNLEHRDGAWGVVSSNFSRPQEPGHGVSSFGRLYFDGSGERAPA